MKIKDVQKQKLLNQIITIRIAKEDKKFIEENKINVGLIVRKIVKNLREKK